MPWYAYRCDSNDTTLEVTHPMTTTVRTWGELCALADHPRGDTPPDAPVRKPFEANLPRIGEGGPKRTVPMPTPPGPCGGGCACHPG